MVDDLITRGTREPYRMFTSRAEYRLLLREDNADLRLTPKGRELDLVGDERWARFERKREAIEKEQERLRTAWIRPGDLSDEQAVALLGAPLSREVRAGDLLSRPNLGYGELMRLPGLGPGVDDPQVAQQLEVQARYAGYIERQRAEIERQRSNEACKLPDDFDYRRVRGLSAEVREKFLKHRPATLGQAARIPGVTPAAVSLLLIHIKRKSARWLTGTWMQAGPPGWRRGLPSWTL